MVLSPRDVDFRHARHGSHDAPPGSWIPTEMRVPWSSAHWAAVPGHAPGSSGPSTQRQPRPAVGACGRTCSCPLSRSESHAGSDSRGGSRQVATLRVGPQSLGPGLLGPAVSATPSICPPKRRPRSSPANLAALAVSLSCRSTKSNGTSGARWAELLVLEPSAESPDAG